MQDPARDGHEEARQTTTPRLDAAGLQDLLEHKVAGKPTELPGWDLPLPERRQGGDRRVSGQAFAWRMAKLTAAAAVLVGLSLAPLRSMLQTSSVEAVVNARIVSVRAPIDGVVGGGKYAVSLGFIVNYGQQMLAVQNIRADSARLDDIMRTIGRLNDERPALVARLEAARKAFANVKDQVETFRDGRRRELDAKFREYAANVTAAHAKTSQAEDTARRFTKLVAQNYVSQIEFNQAQTNVAVARAAEAAAEHQLESVAVERDAVVKGAFVGDTYNDRPSSVQRAEELVQRISDLEADLGPRDAQAARLAAEAVVEAEKFNGKAEAAVMAPVRGRVFDIMAAPGEEVHRGQDLVRLIDCSETLVTATVSETAYNRLHIGGKARFRLANERVDREGAIVSLAGSAETISQAMAIQPTSGTKENFRVMVAVPGLDEAASCNIGRTGRVVFENSSQT
jgi:multidrug resistance efflux pump